jgi:hypothetical protein
MDVKRPSYRSIVCEEVKEHQDVVLHFKDWNEVSDTLQVQSSGADISSTKGRNIEQIKAGFFSDFSDFIMQLTLEVKSYYGFHGIANDISVEKVIDCFEKSVIIDVIDDNSNNEISSDDDDATFS